MHRVSEQSPLAGVVKGDTGFIAGGLDPKDEHSIDFDTIRTP
jgi:hypothetical protein